MKNLKVNVPEGYEIDKEKSTFENIVFKENNTEQQKEDLFNELFQGLKIKSYKKKFPNSVFYFREDRCVLEKEKSFLWVSYEDIWNVFEKEFNMSYFKIQSFIEKMVEKHFDWRELTVQNKKPKIRRELKEHLK